MVCERCGNTLLDHATICPVCGTASPKGQASVQPPTTYGQYPQPGFDDRSTYPRGYAPQSNNPPAPPQPAHPPINYLPTQQVSGYVPAYPPPSIYPVGYIPGHPRLPRKDKSALSAEIILSLIGIFGIGWLLAGETAVGILLLLGSILLYWPIVLAGTAITDGLGLIFLAPLTIGIIIMNSILLNRTLKRKAAHILAIPPAQQPVPPPSRIPLPPNYQ